MNKTTIVVISAHARFISAMPILLLGWVFACYGPSAFYLAVAEQTYILMRNYNFNFVAYLGYRNITCFHIDGF